ncbi:WD40 repeat-like protein [Paxillus ammoniavirescens]|nr:WD40 repeat-like protein [Paxillus ammoniavirescens]
MNSPLRQVFETPLLCRPRMSLPLYNVHHRNHPLALPSVDTLTSSRSVSVEIGSFASVPFTPSGSVAPEIASVASVLSFASSQSVPSDIASQRVPVQIYEGHEDRVYCVSFFPDENKLVSGSHNGSLHIWNRKTGEVNVLSGHTRMVVDVDVSPEGKMVVSGSGDRTVRIWNGESGEMIQNLEGHKNLVISVQFSPDSSRVVSGSDDGTVRVWSVETGELAFESMECYGLVLCVRYSPSGDRIASGANSIQIWDAQTGSGILSIRNSKVTSLVWTVDGTHIIGDHGGNITIWNSHNGEPLRTWKVHDDTTNIIVTTLSLSPCGAHLASSNWGKNTTFVYDISTGEQVAAFEHGQTSKGIAYPPSGKFIAMGCEDTKVYVWEVPSFEDPQTKPQKSSASSLDSLFLDRPAIPLAGLSRNNEIDQFWDSQPDVHTLPFVCAYSRKQKHRVIKIPHLESETSSQTYSLADQQVPRKRVACERRSNQRMSPREGTKCSG